MARVIIVPGLAVRAYAEPAARALRARGHDTKLLVPPAWRGAAADLRSYGRRLADQLNQDGRTTSVLVGMSVGTQAAAVAATATDLVEHLLLISPTVDPAKRSRVRLVASWTAGEDHPDSPTWRSQVPDWSRAGLARIFRGFSSAIEVHLEDVLPDVDTDLTVVHADADQLTSHAYAAALAYANGGRLLLAPNAPHSWPTGDPDRFVRLIDELVE